MSIYTKSVEVPDHETDGTKELDITYSVDMDGICYIESITDEQGNKVDSTDEIYEALLEEETNRRERLKEREPCD